MLELLQDECVGPKIKDLEAKTLALRSRALTMPSIMVHSRYQCPYPMLRDTFLSDPVVRHAFHPEKMVPLRDFGTSPLHFLLIRDAEAALNLKISSDLLAYLECNRDVHKAFEETQERWMDEVGLPESLKGNEDVSVWLKKDRKKVGKVRAPYNFSYFSINNSIMVCCN